MKTFRSLSLLVAVLIAMACHAQTDYETNAIEFLSQKWNLKQTQHNVRSVSKKMKQTLSSQKIGLTTIVNVSEPNNEGFVIYAPGDSKPVIGYSDSQTLDLANIPEALASMLKGFPTVTPDNTYPVSVEPVAPIIKTKWGQQAPFNGKCPKYQGQETVTGCTAVAVAQILNHYRSDNFGNYTLEYLDTKSKAEISVDFGKTSYEWDNMLDEYTEGNYTQAQADAVAKLMFEAGAASMCEYEPNKASGKWGLVALDRYFNYKAEFLFRKNLPTSYWMNKIYSELQAGRPIIYCGSATKTNHEFIIDGCDAEGLVHINWGWNGLANGYFDVTYCNSGEQGDYSEGYSNNHLMICGITPRTSTDEPYKERYINVSGTSLYTGYSTYPLVLSAITTNFYKNDGPDLEWSIVYIDYETGEMLNEPEPNTVSSDAFFPSYKQHSSRGEVLPIGKKCKILMVSRKRGSEAPWTFTELPLKPWVKIGQDGLHYSEVGYDDYDGIMEWDYTSPRFEITEFTPLTDVMSGTTFYAKITSKSLLDNGSGHSAQAHIGLIDEATGKVYTSTKNVTLWEQAYYGLGYSGVIKVESIVNPDNQFSVKEGNYKLAVIDVNTNSISNDFIVPDIHVDVKPKAEYPYLQYAGYANFDKQYMTGCLSDAAYTTTQNFTQDKNIYLRTFAHGATWSMLTSANNVFENSTINVYLCPADDKTLKSEFVIATLTANMFPSIQTDIPMNVNLYPLEGKYMLYMRYLTPDGEKDILPERWDHVDPETGIGRIPTEIYVSPAEGSTFLPRIEISNINVSPNSVSFDAKNTGSHVFNGYLRLSVIDSKNGRQMEKSTNLMNLAANETKKCTLAIDVPEEAYSCYVQCSAASTAPSNELIYSYATLSDGGPAKFVSGDATAIEDIWYDNNATEVARYSLDGVLLTKPIQGINIVKYSDGTTRKEIIK